MRFLSIVIAGLFCVTTVAAEPPRLVSSEPAHGALDVSVDAGVLRLRFDRDMDTGAWTLWRSDKGAFPPQRGTLERPWRNARTFELPLARLEPDKTYAIQLNSSKKQRFRAADGTPLPVTLIVFKTAPGFQPPPKKGIVGTWVHREPGRGSMQLGLANDGTYARLVTAPDGKQTLDQGSWTFTNGVLELRPKGEQPQRFNCRVEGDTLVVNDRMRLTRKGKRGGAHSLVGAWKGSQGDTVIELKFNADGTCSRTIHQGGQSRVEHAKYRHAGTTLELSADGETVGWTLKFLGKDTADITDQNGVTTRYTRSAGGTTRGIPRTSTGNILFITHKAGKMKIGNRVFDAPASLLWVMNGDGSNRRQLLTNEKTDVLFGTPRWTADGNAILFSSNFEWWTSALGVDAWVWPDRGAKSPVRITGHADYKNPGKGTGTLVISGINDTGRNWKENAWYGWQGHVGTVSELEPGTMLVRNVPAGRIWVKLFVNKHIGGFTVVDVPVNGKVTAKIPYSTGNFYATRPSITPDARYMVVQGEHAYWDTKKAKLAAAKGLVFEGSSGIDTISVVNLRTGQEAARWKPDQMRFQFAMDPVLSPDGRWIAFAHGIPYSRTSLAVMPLDSMLRGTPQPKDVVRWELMPARYYDYNMDPAWTPDGRRLVFTRIRANFDGTYSGDLYVVNADGSGMQQITRLKRNQCGFYPSVSPDGRRVAFQLITSNDPVLRGTDHVRLNLRSDVWTIGIDGTNPRQLTNDGRSADPAWGP